MIDSIRLQHFRSYRDSSFEFDPGVNIVIGPNASGKTNLLEAILVLALGKSFRARDFELIQFGKPWARLDGFFGSQSRTVKLKSLQGLALQKSLQYHNSPIARSLLASKADKEFVIDEKPLKRLNLEKTVPIVLFEPNHLQLTSRGPEQRRTFFDGILERTLPGFKALAANYRRVLAQRNALLKQSPNRARQQLFAWDVRLSELGAQIADERFKLIEETNKKISKSYSRIADARSKVELIYETPFARENYSSRLLLKLEKSSELDMARGFTAYGPHREDILIYLNKKPVSLSASRGETRSIILALKIYELDLIEKARGAKPIFLLDDVFSELDGARRHHLVDSLKDHQTIITTTDADTATKHFTEGHRTIAL